MTLGWAFLLGSVALVYVCIHAKVETVEKTQYMLGLENFKGHNHNCSVYKKSQTNLNVPTTRNT